MRRSMLLSAVVVVLVSLVAAPGATHPEEGSIDPTGRVTAWVPGPAGGERTLTLQYGPYVIGPGQDLSRVDFETVGADGFVIAAKPALRLPNGLEPLNTEVHLHHAHWVWFDPNANGYNRWFFGTGEERTRGDGGLRILAEDPSLNRGYGIQMRRGDPLLLVSMVHNKTATPVTVWIEAQFTFVDGTREEIAAAPSTPPAGYPEDARWWGGRDFHPMIPTLHGRTFNVPKDPDGIFIHPKDLGKEDGHVWTSPFDGTIIIGAGHLHGGGKTVVVENLGSESDPCPNDGNGIAGGTTIFKAHAFYRPIDPDNDGVFHTVSPSEDLQMGITKPGWRVKIRKGDRIALNGIYDTTKYAYWDAMSFFGFYTDTAPGEGREEGGSCAAYLLPGDTTEYENPDPAESILNRSWDLFPQLPVCGVEYGAKACERPQTFTAGDPTDTINIAGFLYLPGSHDLTANTGVPVVKKGETLRFVNEDYAMNVRHTVTSCPAPCNGTYVANYPQSDGLFDSAILGPDPLVRDTYNKEGYVYWDLDTSTLEPDVYTFYCRIHPFMRGAFMVQE